MATAPLKINLSERFKNQKNRADSADLFVFEPSKKIDFQRSYITFSETSKLKNLGHQVQYLAAADVDGAVIITTPQEVALLDVRKEISFCKKVGLPIIGVVENMAAFVCPKCKGESVIFPPTSGGAEKMCAEMGIPLLGRLPLDPRIGKCCDEGKSFLAEIPDSPAAKSFLEIIQKIQAVCKTKTQESVEAMETT